VCLLDRWAPRFLPADQAVVVVTELCPGVYFGVGYFSFFYELCAERTRTKKR
jgi:hypothetical protein